MIIISTIINNTNDHVKDGAIMFVCLCKGVTDTQIKDSIAQGAQSLKDVRKQLGVATQCCKCLPAARSVIDEALEQQSLFNMQSNAPLFYSA